MLDSATFKYVLFETLGYNICFSLVERSRHLKHHSANVVAGGLLKSLVRSSYTIFRTFKLAHLARALFPIVGEDNARSKQSARRTQAAGECRSIYTTSACLQDG